MAAFLAVAMTLTMDICLLLKSIGNLSNSYCDHNGLYLFFTERAGLAFTLMRWQSVGNQAKPGAPYTRAGSSNCLSNYSDQK